MLRFFPMIVICAGLALPVAAQQQENSAPPPQQNPPASTSSTNQKPATAADPKTAGQKPAQPKKKPSTSEQNPFPEAQSEAAAHQTQQPSDGSTPQAPTPEAGDKAAGDKQAGDKQAGDKQGDSNPFPETQSEKAAKQDRQPSSGAAPEDKPDENSSSSQISPKLLDIPGDKDANNAAVESPQLAVKDTQVGTFYLKTGDYKGAYDRFVEATRVDPGNADAVFGLAESARRLNHRDEAIRNYRLYLSALPDGPRAKEARKALKEMGVSAGS
jgi:tetratricopeptide (TPR) repeat protein